jgi:hypothetical protein
LASGQVKRVRVRLGTIPPGLSPLRTRSVGASRPSSCTTSPRRRGEKQQVVLFGAGAVGSHLAVRLAECGIGILVIHDTDLLRPGNVVRHVGRRDQVGLPKADVVKTAIPSSRRMRQKRPSPQPKSSAARKARPSIRATTAASITYRRLKSPSSPSQAIDAPAGSPPTSVHHCHARTVTDGAPATSRSTRIEGIDRA